MQQAVAIEPRSSLSKVSRRSDETYRHYRLVAGQKGDGYAAVAYAGRIQAFTVTGDTLDSATKALKTIIDDDFRDRAARRGGGTPTSQDFELALNLMGSRKTAVQQHILERTWMSDGGAVSLPQLQLRSDFGDDAIVRGLSRMARHIAEILDYSLPKGAASTAAALEMIIQPNDTVFDPHSDWTFRGEFVVAVRRHMTR